MLKKLEETMSRELKENMRTQSHQRENINKETDICTDTNSWVGKDNTSQEKNHQRGSTGDLKWREREAVDLKTH